MESVPENREKIIGMLQYVDCISPNLEEARLLMGLEETDDILKKYIDCGAKKVVIRAGAEGSSYADADGNFFKVPIVRVDEVVDQTGAGNAYCGGLVVGFMNSDSIQDALCKAAVAASFTLEQFGALYPLDDIEKRAEERFRACKRVMGEGNL